MRGAPNRQRLPWVRRPVRRERQFDSIEVALWQLLLLAAVVGYGVELRTEPLDSR